jgi:hypothetical protein
MILPQAEKPTSQLYIFALVQLISGVYHVNESAGSNDVPFLSRFYALSALNVTPNKLSATVRVLNDADNELAEKRDILFRKKGRRVAGYGTGL